MTDPGAFDSTENAGTPFSVITSERRERDVDALAGDFSVSEVLQALSKVDELCAEPLVVHDARQPLEDMPLALRGRRGEPPPSACD
jgi:hypothetical protein